MGKFLAWLAVAAGAVTIALAAYLYFFAAQAGHFVFPSGAVGVTAVCDDYAILIEEYTKPDGKGIAGTAEGCRSIPTTIFQDPVIHSGPFTDFDGDKFYIVELSRGVYTIAWPGINASPDFPRIGKDT